MIRSDGARLRAPNMLRWDVAFTLATNRFVLYDMTKVIGFTYGVMLLLVGSIVGFADGLGAVVAFARILTAIMAVFALLFVAVMVVFFGNRYPARYTLTAKGALMESLSRRARGTNVAAIVLGVLARRPGLAGAGMLAASEEAVSIAWRDVRRIREHPDHCVMSLMNGWRVVIRLYCTPENYEAALAFARAHARKAA
jgi:hypothetical protein